MGMLVLELADRQRPESLLLPAERTALLGAAMAGQLGRWLGGDELALVWAAGLYDPAQLLRPRFPLHQELADLFHAGQRQGAATGQVLSFAARDGRMGTATLQPDETLATGTILAIPVALVGAEAAVERANAVLEARLGEEGLADPAIVRELGDALGLRFEHARWMTMLDLAAMSVSQLEHIGFASAWSVIEEFLFADPPQPLSLQSAFGQPLAIIDGQLWLEFEPYSLHARRHVADLASWLQRVHELRILQALFRAHAIPMRLRLPGAAAGQACGRQDDELVVETLAEGKAACWYLHEDPQLGVVAATATAADGRTLAHHYPLSPMALARLVEGLGGSAAAAVQRGGVRLAGDGLDLNGAEIAVTGAPPA